MQVFIRSHAGYHSDVICTDSGAELEPYKMYEETGAGVNVSWEKRGGIWHAEKDIKHNGGDTVMPILL